MSNSFKRIFKLKMPRVVPRKDVNTPETLLCLWPFFVFSRFIGMCPVSREGDRIVVRSYCHPTWYFTWVSLVIHTALWINYAFVCFFISTSTSSLIAMANYFIYLTHILGNCVYMKWKAREIPMFIQSCIKVEEICRSYEEEGNKSTSLLRQAFFLFLFFTLAQVVGNGFYYTSFGMVTDAKFWLFFHIL